MSRPFGVLCVETMSHVFVKKGMCSGEELVFMTFHPNCWENVPLCPGMMKLNLGCEEAIDHLVRAALMLEFVFRTEADRDRWINRHSFEMYREIA